MTPADADKRIILSRQTLQKWKVMFDAGIAADPSLPLMQEEVSVLLGIAEEWPGKASKIETLASDWRALISKVIAKKN